MMARCTTPTHQAIPQYGGRGITVAPAWTRFEAFRDYVLAVLGPKPPDKSLDRIDNDGNYEPGNIRWATRSEQQKNRRPNQRDPVTGRFLLTRN
jgi:hypothetical protein